MSSKEPPTTCPVDHKAPEAWLTQARAAGSDAPPPAKPEPQAKPQPSPPVQTSCSSSSLDHATASPPAPSRLSTHRETSTIPRAALLHPTSHPANSERDAAPSPSGNWIYPSEAMFFAAMQRKSLTPSAPDMSTIVPIHNAVNERAWSEIKDWEAGLGSEACGGPKLVSFSGLSTTLTPRARWNVLRGYMAPFDRHDWLVERCGERVEYVIDFYQGREARDEKGLNFYLDVRPKLNSWEGVRMRVARFWGSR